jgi:hypothetical protein
MISVTLKYKLSKNGFSQTLQELATAELSVIHYLFTKQTRVHTNIKESTWKHTKTTPNPQDRKNTPYFTRSLKKCKAEKTD